MEAQVLVVMTQPLFTVSLISDLCRNDPLCCALSWVKLQDPSRKVMWLFPATILRCFTV